MVERPAAPIASDPGTPAGLDYGVPIGRQDGLRHAHYPVQVLVRSRRHLFQIAFARDAVGRAGPIGDGWLLQAGADGLVVMGRTESALRAALEHVRHLFRVDVHKDAAREEDAAHEDVWRCHGTNNDDPADRGRNDGGLDDGPVRIRRVAGEPPCEPIMQVLVRVPRPLRHAILHDLAKRDAWAVRVNARLAPVTISACVRLADAIGYEARVERIAAGMAEVKMRLSHYAPARDGLAAFAPGPDV